jgi:hypothetical protein
MLIHQAQHASCVWFRAADGLPHLRPQQIDHHDPARPDHVDMGRRMVALTLADL